jgi:hypothetical protein
MSVSLLDVPHPELGPRTQVSRRHRLLHFLEEADQTVSTPVHSLPSPLLLEAVVLVPALLFSAYAVPVLLALAFAFLPPPFALLCGGGCILTLGLTTFLKRYFRRIRPGLHAAAHRRFNIRSWEKASAMPSGDSAQAALWCTLAAWRFDEPRILLLIPCTQFGRVFFACHWWGDTFVGAALGYAMAHVVLILGGALCSSGHVPWTTTVC